MEAIIVQNLKNAYGKLPDIVGGGWRRARRASPRRAEVGFAGRLVPRPSIALGNLGRDGRRLERGRLEPGDLPQTDRASSELRREKTEATEARRRSTARILSYMRGRRSARAGARRRGRRGGGRFRDESASLDPFVRGESLRAAPAPLPRGAKRATPKRRGPAASGLTPHAFESDSPLETPGFSPRLERAFERA